MAPPPFPPYPVPLYGVLMREAIQTGDRELMQSMLKVSEFLMAKTGEGLEDWKAAHAELAKAL